MSLIAVCVHMSQTYGGRLKHWRLSFQSSLALDHGKALAEYAEKKTIDEKEVSTEIGRNGVWGLDAAEVIKEMAERIWK